MRPERDGAAPVEWPVPEAACEAYPVDTDFPSLGIASDPVRMLEVFRAHLKPIPGKACRILDCTPSRFRCRQRGRCVLQYTLRLADADTGHQWDQWVTGLLYSEPGEAEAKLRRMRAGKVGAQVPEPWNCLEPVTFIHELNMVVEVFPHDRRLPQLGQVLDGASRDLAPLLLERLGSGRWQAAGSATLEPRRYRTELGAVLRCVLPVREADSRRREQLTCYLKIYRNERGRETFELLREWWGRLPADRRGYALVRPIAYWSEHRTLVLEEAAGVSLRDRLLEDREPLAAVRAAARALAAFHQDDLNVGRHHTLSDQLGQVKRASAIVQWACPRVRAKVRGIAAAVAAGLKEAPPRPFHGDLKADHIFLSGDRVTFVDNDAIAMGDPVRDAAHFCSYLAGRVGLDAIPPAKAQALARAFTTEYFSHVPDAWRGQFALHYAGALVEVACGIFRHQQPWWLAKSEAAIEEARRALEGELEGWLPEAAPRESSRRVQGGDRREEAVALWLTMPHLAVMQVLWARGEATPRQVTDHLDRSRDQSTVTALLEDLEIQGVVSRRVASGQRLYRAAVAQTEMRQTFLEGFASFADDLFEGDMVALVSQLLRVHDVNTRDLARLNALLETTGRKPEENEP